MTTDTNSIGQRIKQRRLELKMTQCDLSRACGWFQGKVSEIEAGKREYLTVTDLLILAEQLDTTAAALLG